MVQKRTRLVNTIQMLSVVSLVVLAVLTLGAQILGRHDDFRRRADEMRTKFVAQQKRVIRREVERVIERVGYQRSQTQERAQALAKEMVYRAYEIARNLYEQNRETRTIPEIKKLIVDTLRLIRFDERMGNLFIHDLDGQIIMVADRSELEGKHFSEIKSVAEQNVFKAMIALSEKHGEGYYRYLWTKPGTEGNQHPKIAYVKQFEPFRWNIGTGVYEEDIEARTQLELLKEIFHVKYGQNGYMFVDTWDGVVLTHGAQPDLIGINIWDFEDANGVKVVQNLIAAARTEAGDFVYYSWRKPDTGEERPKISFAKGVHEWRWMVGTGVYVDDVEADIAALQAALDKEIYRQIWVTALITLTIVTVALLFFRGIRNRLMNDFGLFATFFNKAAYADTAIDCDRVRFEELYQIARDGNKMLRDKVAAQRRVQEEREQLAVTLRSIAEGVITTDTSGNVTLMNPGAESLTGWKESEGMGKPLEEVFAILKEDSQEKAENPVEAVLGGGGRQELSEVVTLRGQEGTQRPITHSAAPIEDADGRLHGVVLVFRDMTEARRMEQERLRLRKLESVGTLAGGIAHDFNNLLMSLQGNMELARLNMKTDVVKALEFFKAAEASLMPASQLAVQLLTFAKGGAPIKEIMYLRQILLEMAQFALRGSNVKLDTAIDPELWAVAADRGQLSQVVTNLVINARQAMPAGGILRIKACNVEETDDPHVEITFQDDGPGIPPEHLEKIFDPYFTTKENGSGLGLASCHSIVTKHNGTIAVESVLGQGTNFVIRLPASLDKLVQRDLTADEEEPTTFARSSRILILDDEAAVRQMLEAMLQRMGHEVTKAGSGTEAVVKYRESWEQENVYDLVITDLTLPGEAGGEEVARKLLGINPDARIIVSSGYTTGSVMADYKRYGFYAFIAKPYGYGNLCRVVENALGANDAPF